MSIIFLLGGLITLLSAIPIVRQLRKEHPRGLVILFFAEMWERFSYYGMRGLLIFYLTQHFLLDGKLAAARYSSYTTMVAMLPIAAAIIVDRWLGTRKAVAFGALLLVAGHLTMAIEGAPAQSQLSWHGQTYAVVSHGRASAREAALNVGGHDYKFHSNPDGAFVIEGLPPGAPVPAVIPKSDYKVDIVHENKFGENMLFLALSLIVIGVSFLRTSPLVAQLYGRDDPRRDSGFTIYYYGVNLGAFWAGLLCGWLGETVGWWAGFGLAAVGMSLGYIVFILGKPLLDGKGEPRDPVMLAKPIGGVMNLERFIYLGALAMVGFVWLMLHQRAFIGYLLYIVTALALSYLTWFMVKHCTGAERKRIGLAFILMLGSVVFWTLFEQAGSSLALFAATNTNLDILGAPIRTGLFGHDLIIGSKSMLGDLAGKPGVWWVDTTLNAPQTQSFNPGFILMLAPIFAALWAWLGRRGANPPPMFKFGIALLQVGGGFLLLVLGARFADPSFRVPLYFLLGAYFLHTTGELCLSPVGLSVVSRLAPPAIVATLLGMWGLSGSWAQFIGGKIAGLTTTESVGGQVLDAGKALSTACTVFGIIGLVAMGIGVVFIVLGPLVRRWGEDSAPEVAPAAPVPATV